MKIVVENGVDACSLQNQSREENWLVHVVEHVSLYRTASANISVKSDFHSEFFKHFPSLVY
jgi:hypothetical protein